MSKNRLMKKKYVLMAFAVLLTLVIGSLVVNYNYKDLLYLLFIAFIFLKFIISKLLER